MDINKLANTAMDNKYGCIVSSRLEELEKKVFLEAYREGALAGYTHATTWFSMEEAPQVSIQDIVIAFKYNEETCTGEGYWSTIDSCWVTARGSKIDNPIAWTHLPVYKP